jgi:hypothetical protein
MKLTYRILMLCLDFKAWKVVKLEGWWGGRHGKVVEIERCALAKPTKSTDLCDQARNEPTTHKSVDYRP